MGAAGKKSGRLAVFPSRIREDHPMADFSKLLVLRRSIRDYQDKPVSTNLITELIGEACLAPSSGNGQPWKFIVICDRDLIKRLSDESKKNLIADMQKTPDHPSRRYEVALKNEAFNVFYNAPRLVIVAGPAALYSTRVDCALAAGYLMLAAADRGLGTCWINLGSHIREPGLKAEIGLPEDHIIVAPIIIGWPKAIPPIPERKQPAVLKIIE
jgi:nitroreductase